MKAINFILFGFVLLFASCSSDEPIEFAGSYSGDVICFLDGETNIEESIIVISENADGSFRVNIDTELTFTAIAEDNVLILERQMEMNSDEEIYLEGTITANEAGTFLLVVTVESEDEIAECTMTMTP